MRFPDVGHSAGACRPLALSLLSPDRFSISVTNKIIIYTDMVLQMTPK